MSDITQSTVQDLSPAQTDNLSEFLGDTSSQSGTSNGVPQHDGTPTVEKP